MGFGCVFFYLPFEGYQLTIQLPQSQSPQVRVGGDAGDVLPAEVHPPGGAAAVPGWGVVTILRFFPCGGFGVKRLKIINEGWGGGAGVTTLTL